MRGEWFGETAVLASILYIIMDVLGFALWPATIVTFIVSFIFFGWAQIRGLDEPEIE